MTRSQLQVGFKSLQKTFAYLIIFSLQDLSWGSDHVTDLKMDNLVHLGNRVTPDLHGIIQGRCFENLKKHCWPTLCTTMHYFTLPSKKSGERKRGESADLFLRAFWFSKSIQRGWLRTSLFKMRPNSSRSQDLGEVDTFRRRLPKSSKSSLKKFKSQKVCFSDGSENWNFTHTYTAATARLRVLRVDWRDGRHTKAGTL